MHVLQRSNLGRLSALSTRLRCRAGHQRVLRPVLASQERPDPTEFKEVAAAFQRAWPEAMRIFRADMQFRDLWSFLLFGLGILLSIAAFWKGYTLDDKYPGHGHVAKELKKAVQAEHELQNQLRQKVKDLLHHRKAAVQAAIHEPSTQMGMLARRIADLTSSEIASVSTELQTSLRAVADILATAGTHAAALAGHSTQNAKSLEQSHRLAQDVDALRSASDTVNALLAKLASSVEHVHGTLESTTGSLRNAISTATASLEGDVKRSSDVARLFSERLSDVAQIIIDKTQEHGRQPS